MATTISSNTQHLDSFPRFLDLPIELRTLIWRATLEPRVVEMYLEYPLRVRLAFLPRAFAVHKESRELLKSIYRPLFKNGAPGAGFRGSCADYFNFSMDAVLLRNATPRYKFVKSVLNSLSKRMTDHAKVSLETFGVELPYFPHSHEVLAWVKLEVERWHSGFPQLKSFFAAWDLSKYDSCMHRRMNMALFDPSPSPNVSMSIAGLGKIRFLKTLHGQKKLASDQPGWEALPLKPQWVYGWRRCEVCPQHIPGRLTS